MREESAPDDGIVRMVQLERNGSPGDSAPKTRLPPGCQKFTSSRCGRWLRNRYQSLSVTATQARTVVS